MLDIASQLRCAVCQSQSVAESNSDLANDMKEIIGEQLDDGVPADEIIDYFVQRYGDYILMSPPTDGAGRLLWWLPLIIIGLVLCLVGWQIRLRARASASIAGDDSSGKKLADEQQQRLRALREQQR